MYPKEEFSTFFFTKKGLTIAYWAILSLALVSKLFLIVSVFLSSALLIYWLIYHPVSGKTKTKSFNLYLLGLVVYIIGAPFFADPHHLTFLKIGTALFFFSRLFLFQYFYFHLKYINYFSLRHIVYLFPFVFSLVYSHFFLSYVVPDEVLIFVIPLTFVDALFVSTIPAFVHEGHVKKLYVLVVLFMAILDHLGGYFIYSESTEIAVWAVRILSAFLKLFLTFLVFEINQKCE